MSQPVRYDICRLTDEDLYWFNEGTHYRLYDKLGAHHGVYDGIEGTHFAVWAPNADHVSVIGDFNYWQPGQHALVQRGFSGIWTGFIPGIKAGETYKYHIATPINGYQVDKADPFGAWHEEPPRTGSRVADLSYTWADSDWMSSRAAKNDRKSPISIYELHLGSWMRVPEDGNRWLTYREIAPKLAAYAQELGFTHVELLPIMEHPFYASWGYQTTGQFAPTSRYGSPADFMFLVDTLHQAGVGVILDWVPSHFPSDEHALGFFDGTHTFEHEDPRKGYHPDWKSLIYNYGRHEVRAFLISSAMCWMDRFHVDGIRVDAVASMLYLDYSRKEGEWLPNPWGGKENVEAIEFLRQLNCAIYKEYPDTLTVAEESTSWPLVSRPASIGGLGFGYKWDMGWMHDSLEYMKLDPVHRKYHHNELTFRGMYQFSENFVLPLSHDEVVYGKGSLIRKMSGDDWQRFANLRLLLTNQWLQPGKKLLFMGGEIAQWNEWNHDLSLDWHLLSFSSHKGVQQLVGDLNRVYRAHAALHAQDCEPGGFHWVDPNNVEESVLSFIRRAPDAPTVLGVFNYTPIPRHSYRIGVPYPGRWKEVLNTDAQVYGGSGIGNEGGTWAEAQPWHGQPYSVRLSLPPLAALVLVGED